MYAKNFLTVNLKRLPLYKNRDYFYDWSFITNQVIFEKYTFKERC